MPGCKQYQKRTKLLFLLDLESLKGLIYVQKYVLCGINLFAAGQTPAR
jgi:hypothetical protein